MTVPKRYVILRQVVNDSRISVPVDEKPRQVWTLIDEAGFLVHGLVHNKTAFIEDRIHDWQWIWDCKTDPWTGIFRFYGHSGARGEKHDLVLVYER